MYGGFTLLWILRELSGLVPQQLLGGMAHSDQLGQNLRKCSLSCKAAGEEETN